MITTSHRSPSVIEEAEAQPKKQDLRSSIPPDATVDDDQRRSEGASCACIVCASSRLMLDERGGWRRLLCRRDESHQSDFHRWGIHCTNHELTMRGLPLCVSYSTICGVGG